MSSTKPQVCTYKQFWHRARTNVPRAASHRPFASCLAPHPRPSPSSQKRRILCPVARRHRYYGVHMSAGLMGTGATAWAAAGRWTPHVPPWVMVGGVHHPRTHTHTGSDGSGRALFIYYCGPHRTRAPSLFSTLHFSIFSLPRIPLLFLTLHSIFRSQLQQIHRLFYASRLTIPDHEFRSFGDSVCLARKIRPSNFRCSLFPLTVQISLNYVSQRICKVLSAA
jgi:hypothetical protein